MEPRTKNALDVSAAIYRPGRRPLSLCSAKEKVDRKRNAARGGIPVTPRVTRYGRAGSISAVEIDTSDAPGADNGSVYTMEARTYIQAALGEDLGAEPVNTCVLKHERSRPVFAPGVSARAITGRLVMPAHRHVSTPRGALGKLPQAPFLSVHFLWASKESEQRTPAALTAAVTSFAHLPSPPFLFSPCLYKPNML